MRRETTAANDAEAEIRKAQRAIRRDILALTRELDVGGSADAREAVLEAVRGRIARLEKRLARVENAALEYAAREAVRDGSEKTGLEVRYSKERADEMIGLLAGKSGRNLAAVFTENMAANVIDALRTATVAAMRENAVAGGTKKELARALEEKWLGAAKDGETFQFVDAGGHVWDTKTYVAMNVRTNAMRVYNDSLADTIGRATGSDLVRVSTGGDPDCRLCFPWEGRILSLTGKTKGFPSYEEAREAGLFHPNCTHTLEAIDELLDEEEIALQKAHPIDAETATPEELDENRYEIDQDRYRRQGMDEEQARLAVDRDNLEASIRAGLLRDDARQIVDGMTDAQVTALCPNGNPPSFEPTKKATRDDPHAADEKWRRGSRGGTVHIDRNADLARILDVTGVRDARTPEPPALDESGFPRSIADSRMTVISDSIGGTTGAKLVEIGGEKFILKSDTRVSAEHILNEAAADAAYLRAGVRVPDCRTYREGGRTYKLSRFIEGGKSLGDYLKTATPEQRAAVIGELKQGYILDALFANWDVLGTGGDNVLIDRDGHAWRIDNGSAFGFRAQGARKKPEEWERREWPDEWRTLRTSPINRGVFDQLTAHDIFSSKVDLDAAMRGLPEETRRALEKPLEEIRQMQRRCENFDTGGYQPSHTSKILEASYDLSKAGMREICPNDITEFVYNDPKLKGNLRPDSSGTNNLVANTSIAQDIKNAYISIAHHINQGDNQPNMATVNAALAHTAVLKKASAWDANAKSLLDVIAIIDKSSASGFSQIDKAWVDVLPVNLNGGNVAKPPACFGDILDAYAAKSGIDIDRAVRMFSDQGGSSSSSGSCRMKVLEMEAIGLDPLAARPEVYKRRGVDGAAAHYAANPAEKDKDEAAYCLWKAATQLVLENTPLPFKDDANRTVRLMRTGSFGLKFSDKGKILDFVPEGAHESYGSFHTVVITGRQLVIRDVPYSRISSIYLTQKSSGGDLYLGDGENEIGANTIGLKAYYHGDTKPNVGYSTFTKEIADAETRQGRTLR